MFDPLMALAWGFLMSGVAFLLLWRAREGLPRPLRWGLTAAAATIPAVGVLGWFAATQGLLLGGLSAAGGCPLVSC